MRLGEYQTTAGGMVTSTDPHNHDIWQGFIRALHAAHERGEVVVTDGGDAVASAYRYGHQRAIEHCTDEKLRAENAELRKALDIARREALALVKLERLLLWRREGEAFADFVTRLVDAAQPMRHEGDAAPYTRAFYRTPSSGPMKLEPPKCGGDPFRVDGSVECQIDNPEVAKAWRDGQERLAEAIGSAVSEAVREHRLWEKAHEARARETKKARKWFR